MPIKKQTHSLAPFGVCADAYESSFGSGFGGAEAAVSLVFGCPATSDARQGFPAMVSYYRQFYRGKKQHFRTLRALKAGQQHFGGFNRLGTQSFGITVGGTISLLFQRDNFLVLLQVTFAREKLVTAEKSVLRLAHLTNHRIMAANP